MRTRTLIVSLLAALAVGAAPAQAADPGDGGCLPTKARPTPVILLHGTFSDPREIWGAVAPGLLDDGFCVFTVDYGERGTASLPESATEVAQFARRVLRRTGARRVSFVGHDQGGMLARYVARFRGLSDRISDIVALAPPSHGTTTPLTPPAAGIVCRACDDLAAGSPAMSALADGDEAPAPIAYTVVMTLDDTVITPMASQTVVGSGAATNVVLQDRCPGDGADHASILTDPAAAAYVRDALLRRGPASRDLQPPCPPAGQPAAPAPGGPQVLGSQSFHPRALLGTTILARPGELALNVGCEGAPFLSCVTELTVRAGGRTVASGRVIVRARRAKAARLVLAQPLPAGVATRLVVRATTQNGAPVASSRAYRVKPRL